jgi:uncharacterized FlaG/YvyC family protein
MPKLTINDKDYYTDDFNEDQMKMYQEIGLAREEMGRMDYLMRVLDARCNMLGGMIVEIAEQEDNNEVKQLPEKEKVQ